MKIICLQSKATYEIQALKAGENTLKCPECNESRKKQNAKPFQWNAAKGTGKCHHCDATFAVFNPVFAQPKKEYKKPEQPKSYQFSEKVAKYFEGRMISRATLEKARIFSQKTFIPQLNGEHEAICFPYYKAGELVNIKYRGPQKSFKVVKDAELIWFNYDALFSAKEIIIVEGEIDALTWIGAGFNNVISVPNGAGASELEYVDNSFNDLEKIEKFYIAVDNDPKGNELKERLIIRLGHEKCNIVTFEDCKDSNEFAVKYGGVNLAKCLQNSYSVPIDGVIDLEKEYNNIYTLFTEGMKRGLTIGLPALDDLISWETGRLAIFTGIPSHGKSELVDYINVKLNILHGYKSAYFSPENYPVAYHYSKLFSKISGKPFKHTDEISPEYFKKYFDYIKNNFFFIMPEENNKIETILDKAKYLVKKHGVKILTIDPYNKLEHQRNRNETETEYISRFLDALIVFAKKYQVLVNLVAHPRKMQKLGGAYEVPTAYDINGSANFYNKADYIMSVHRNFVENNVGIHAQKVKFRHLGPGGGTVLMYELENGRYYHVDSRPSGNKSFLECEAETEPDPIKPDYDIWGTPSSAEPMPF